MKNNHISSYKDLEQEEFLVRNRIKRQEQEIRQRLSQLPDEIVILGITKTITTFTSGKLFSSAGRITRSVISYFIKKAEGEGELQSTVKRIFLNIIEKFIPRKKNTDE